MSRYEFKVLPAPKRPRKLTGLEKDQDKFCATLTDVMTDMGLDGWEFVSAQTLPYEERRFGLFRRVGSKPCLVFRREIERLDQAEQKVAPKRIARAHVVSRVNGGARRITLSDPAENKVYALPGAS
ncbi:hypothetical protein HKCCE3408_10300 [Rhodobacterales bacterium HKCCE3408]|nr:hypothetical protein [Rhodobacterales bacterium HKCCE3408]